MKETSPLRRHYDKFTLPERDRLVLAALGREDWAQIRALVGRCPDADILPHLWNVVILGYVAHSLVAHLLACNALFFRCLTLQSHAQGDDPLPSAARDPLPLLEGAAAAWFGFIAWCQTAGLDARQVLNLALPGSEETDPVRDLVNRQIECFESGAGRPDPLQIDRWHTMFTRLFWSLALDSE